MSESLKKIWFPAKKYGYGWGLPACWQGWVVLIGYLILFFNGRFISGFHNGLLLYIIYISFITCLFLVIVVLKGEKAHWRWGNKD